MIKTFILLLFIFLGKTVICQQYVYNNPKDSSQNFYILRLPKESIKGLLVLNARNLSDSSNQKAQKLGICILTIVPTARPLENLTSNAVLNKMDQIIGTVIRQYKIPSHNLIIGECPLPELVPSDIPNIVMQINPRKGLNRPQYLPWTHHLTMKDCTMWQ
jgi:hypothetical protein